MWRGLRLEGAKDQFNGPPRHQSRIAPSAGSRPKGLSCCGTSPQRAAPAGCPPGRASRDLLVDRIMPVVIPEIWPEGSSRPV